MKPFILIITLFIVAGAAFAAPLPDEEVGDSIPTLERPLALQLYNPPEPQIVPWRLGVYSAMTLGLVGYCFSRMDDWWGRIYCPFHIKHNDWAGDNLAQTDEVSHAFVSYKIAQAATGLSNWSGFKPGTSRIIGGAFAGSIMLFVEYPVDAHNLYQGFGYSDMIANSLGITLALAKNRWPKYLDPIDFRFSIKDLSETPNELIAQTFAQNDNYIYWLTVNPIDDYPFHFGVGYSANHDNPEFAAEREVYLGFGTSIAELAGLYNPKWKKSLQTFNFYELSFALRVH